MSRKKHLSRASALALGLLPIAAMAIGANDGVTTAAPPPAGCAAPGMQPMNVPLEPPAQTLKDAPYSAVGTTEVVTTLADGNRITRTNTMRYFRDGAGRVRTEYQLAAIGPFVPEEAQSIVTIADPVSGQRYVLHPAMKRADVFKLSADSGAHGGPVGGAIFVGSAFTSVGDMSRGGTPGLVQSTSPTRARLRSPLPTRGTDRAPKMMAPSAFNAPTGGVAERGVAVRGEVPGAPGPGFDVMYVNPAAVGMGCGGPNVAQAPKAVSIGERRIEGLKVTGSRLEFTINAGEVGNDQPITVRTDQWFSPDLGVVVSSTHNDPMIGETTYRLEQINRGEPDSSLFVVPSDYTKMTAGF
jgi:hypothetical protein